MARNIVLALLLAVAGAAVELEAQIQLQPTQISGTIVRIIPGQGFQLQDATKQIWNCTVSRQLRQPNGQTGTLGQDITYKLSGQLNVAELSPGLMAQFSVELDEKKNVKAPVDRILIRGTRLEPGQGIGTLPTGEGNAAAVIGRIVKNAKGRLSVDIGARKPLTIEVAPEASIEIESSEPSLISVGDTADVVGVSMGPLFHLLDVKATHTPRVVQEPAKPDGVARNRPGRNPKQPAAAAQPGANPFAPVENPKPEGGRWVGRRLKVN